MLTSLYMKMLNKEASAPKNMPDEILKRLQIREGYTVADIGSGGGYFTREFARKVGKRGKVYAVDTQVKNLDFIQRQSEQEGLNNIAFVPAAGDTVNLPEACLDLMFVRNAFHHLPEPVKYFRNLKKFLKKSGKVAIIEHKPKAGYSFVAMFKHYTPDAVIVRAMEDAGYRLIKSFNFLPEQTFNVLGVRDPS